jgi:hypothetical protein
MQAVRFPRGIASAPMNKSQFFLGPERDLTSDEIDALIHIQAGRPVAARLRHRLEIDELVDGNLSGGWKLTRAGVFRLAARK